MTQSKIPQQKTEKEPYKKWNIKTGWVIVGYLNIKDDSKNSSSR